MLSVSNVLTEQLDMFCGYLCTNDEVMYEFMICVYLYFCVLSGLPWFFQTTKFNKVNIVLNIM